MNRGVLTFTMMMLTVCLAAAQAHADQRGILLLGNIQQYLNVSYDFEESHSAGSTTSTSFDSQIIKERYQLSSDYAIYHPNLLAGSAAVGVTFNQNFYSGQNAQGIAGNGISFNYDIGGTILDGSNYPTTFHVRSDETTVQRDYTGNFNVATDSYNAGFRYRSKEFPLSLTFTQVNTKTTGLGSDIEQQVQNIGFLFSHPIGNVNNTVLSYAHSAIDSRTIEGAAALSVYDSDRFTATNLLSWNSDGKVRSISATYSLLRETGNIDSTSVNAGMGILWDLGRALSLRGDISEARTGTPYRDDLVSKVSLRHRLFNSLSTSIDGVFRKSLMEGLEEKEKNGTMAASYHKSLPWNGLFDLSFSQTYGYFDRTGHQTITTIKDQSFVASYIDPIIIQAIGIVDSSIVIKNSDPTVRATPYSSATDYYIVIDASNTTIFINPTGAIKDGDSLLISYETDIDPSLHYTTSVRSLNGSISLLDNRIRFLVATQDAVETPWGTNSQFQILNDYHTQRAGVQLLTGTSLLDAELSKLHSTEENSSTIETALNHTFLLEDGAFSTYLRGRLSFRHPQPEGQYGGPQPMIREQSANVGIQYNTFLLDYIQTRIRANYLYITGGLRSNDASIIGTMQFQTGKIFIQLLPELHWTSTGNTSIWNEKIRLMITRYF